VQTQTRLTKPLRRERPLEQQWMPQMLQALLQ
jgi:hypothetical protein